MLTMLAAILQNFSYPAGFGGEPPLLEAVASFFNTYFHPSIPVTSNHVVTTPGAGTCLDSLLYTLCDSGDSVIVPGPCWSTSPLLSLCLLDFPKKRTTDLTP